MIKGIGLDVVDLKRIKTIIEKQSKFPERVLTPQEMMSYRQLKGQRQIEYLGGRFACKEAYVKALGTGIGPVSLQDIEILNLPNGQPIMTVAGETDKLFVSISHTDSLAIAQVVIEQKNNLN